MEKMAAVKAEVPLSPFLLNDYSKNEPTSFEFTYV